MRDIKRIKKVLKEIEKIWERFPDWRFGQLLINMGVVDDSIRVWRNEDNDLLKHLKAYYKDVTAEQEPEK